MIRTFKDKRTFRIFSREQINSFDVVLQQKTFDKLRMLHNAVAIIDLARSQANHLEKLRGDRQGQYSIRINNKWRICFYWIDNNAYEVEIVDYH